MEAGNDLLLTPEEITKELCKILAIRYGYADGETIDWIQKNLFQPLLIQLAKVQPTRAVHIIKGTEHTEEFQPASLLLKPEELELIAEKVEASVGISATPIRAVTMRVVAEVQLAKAKLIIRKQEQTFATKYYAKKMERILNDVKRELKFSLRRQLLHLESQGDKRGKD